MTDSSFNIRERLEKYIDDELFKKTVIELCNNKQSYSAFKGILEALSSKTPKQQDSTFITIGFNPEILLSQDEKWFVLGEDSSTQEQFQIRYFMWDEWLGFRVKKEQLQSLGVEEYLVYCLMEMTYVGIDENTIQKEYEKIAEGVASFNPESASNLQDLINCRNLSSDEMVYKMGSEIKGFIKNRKPPKVRPWVRYWARTIDVTTWSLLIFILSKVFIYYTNSKFQFNAFHIESSNLLFKHVNEYIIGFVQISLWGFIEAYLISQFGYTFGKWLLHTEIRKDNALLNYKQALKRYWGVFFFGEGLNVLSIITNIISYGRLTNRGITKWDEIGGFEVKHGEISGNKIIILVIIIAGIPITYYLIYLKYKSFFGIPL